MTRKIDLAAVPVASGCRYPEPFDGPCKGRRWQALGSASGLTLIGVNLVTLEPGVWASQRHWHAREDEFVHVLTGELVSITDDGEEVLVAGDSIGFPAGVEDGHHLVNRSAAPATFLVVSNRAADDHGAYSDIDMTFEPAPGASRYDAPGIYRRKDGTPYPPRS